MYSKNKTEGSEKNASFIDINANVKIFQKNKTVEFVQRYAPFWESALLPHRTSSLFVQYRCISKLQSKLDGETLCEGWREPEGRDRFLGCTIVNSSTLRLFFLVDRPFMLFQMRELFERTIAYPTSILSFVLVNL